MQKRPQSILSSISNLEKNIKPAMPVVTAYESPEKIDRLKLISESSLEDYRELKSSINESQISIAPARLAYQPVRIRSDKR